MTQLNTTNVPVAAAAIFHRVMNDGFGLADIASLIRNNSFAVDLNSLARLIAKSYTQEDIWDKLTTAEHKICQRVAEDVLKHLGLAIKEEQGRSEAQLAEHLIPNQKDLGSNPSRPATPTVTLEEEAGMLCGAWNGNGSLPFSELGYPEHWLRVASAARALGVREAEKNATPFVVDQEKLGQANYEGWMRATSKLEPNWAEQPDWSKRAHVAAGSAVGQEYKRQLAEHQRKLSQ